MKITKKKLKQIIQEALLRETPTPYEKEEALRFQAEDLQQSTRKITAELLVSINQGVVTAEQGDEPDELYIMTGAAEGITVKVIKKGRF